MSDKFCCCCYKTSEILLSINVKSSHDDGKILMDYLNFIFRTLLKPYEASDFICIKCSKALQVAYHFINMVIEPKKSKEHFQIHSEKNILDDARLNENKKTEQKNRIDIKLNTENSLEWQTSNSQMTLDNVLPSTVPDNFKLFSTNSHTDTGSSKISKGINLNLMCNICNIFFKNKHFFVEHVRENHSEIVPYKCQLCSFYTCYAESLFKHCKKNHGLKNDAIDYCYQTEKVPKMVGNNPDFEITFVCVTCNFKSNSETTLDEHLLNEHTTDEDKESFTKKIVACPGCCRSFLTLKSAKIHYSMYHVAKKSKTCDKRTFGCEKCGKLFDLKAGLLMHRRACEDRKGVVCNFCKLKFTSILKYERHLKDTHFVAIKYECETCSKTFNCSEYLTVHRKRHNERLHQCDLCTKNYISNAELKVHKQHIHNITKCSHNI